jgi:hypothetical protein
MRHPLHAAHAGGAWSRKPSRRGTWRASERHPQEHGAAQPPLKVRDSALGGLFGMPYGRCISSRRWASRRTQDAVHTCMPMTGATSDKESSPSATAPSSKPTAMVSWSIPTSARMAATARACRCASGPLACVPSAHRVLSVRGPVGAEGRVSGGCVNLELRAWYE